VDNQHQMRVLIVTNMWPSAERPELGSFVRDQLEALRALEDPDLELECFAFAPGGYGAAARDLRREYRKQRFDVVHAHFGLTAWPSLVVSAELHGLTLHGTDLRHRRSRLITQAALPLIDLVGAASPELAREVPGYPRREVEILPCGVATDRFRPLDRQQARAGLGLRSDGRYLLFPADPARAGKRFDRAQAIAERCNAELLTLGSIEPQQVPLWINAANAVVVPSEREGFGLAVLEALACEVAVVCAPTGIHEAATRGIDGADCLDYSEQAWSELLKVSLGDPERRIISRERAERFSAKRMAERLLASWRAQLGSPLDSAAARNEGNAETTPWD
jgi:glycosyltransferase involved in cell wall biosynthesis